MLEWLDKQGIEYTEVSAKENSEITTTPTIEINEQRIAGFDRVAIKKALKKYGQ